MAMVSTKLTLGVLTKQLFSQNLKTGQITDLEILIADDTQEDTRGKKGTSC